ncbi:MAG TPA: MarR family winged helix-turn-helix transcriptional regulator [Trueperaceae bacterium]|nr:MarR family winged helix-turn-helix transcriptional regulator [Trueperaceae bacterium]
MPAENGPVDFAACRRISRTCTYFNVRRAARILGEAYDRELRRFGLKGTQFSVLVATALLEEPTVGRLSVAMSADRTTITRALAPLERDGWIVTCAGPDRRERRVRLTRAGGVRLARAVEAWERAQRGVVEAMGEEAWSDLLAGAKRVHEVAGALALPLAPAGAEAAD